MVITTAYPQLNSIPWKLDIGNNVFLLWKNAGTVKGGYPTDRMQKGLLLSYGDQLLDEEGTGFGVPIIKLRHETVLPGGAQLTISESKGISILEADFTLNLVKRKTSKGKRIESKTFYRLNEDFASIHRIVPALRGVHTLVSRCLNHLCAFNSQLETSSLTFKVKVCYTIDVLEKTIHITADFSSVAPEEQVELIMTNEQGANYFDHYRESNGGTLAGKAIGSWNPVSGDQASCIDIKHGISFSLTKIPGIKMFRGREKKPGQLAWSGIDYSAPVHMPRFEYDIVLGTTV